MSLGIHVGHLTEGDEVTYHVAYICILLPLQTTRQFNFLELNRH